MTPASRKYKKEYAKDLIQIASGDLDSARGLIQSNMGRPENILYAIQQSIEADLHRQLTNLRVVGLKSRLNFGRHHQGARAREVCLVK
jgi:hypothetical protein